jgi:nitroreductase
MWHAAGRDDRLTYQREFTGGIVTTYETIISKRDTRVFQERPVPDDVMRRILQAGRMAGSSKNSQPCRFVVIDDQQVKADIAACGDFAAWIPSAPVMVGVAVPDEAPRGEYDAGRASQNMMIAAWAEDVGSCPVSMHHVDCARDALSLPPNFRVSVVVVFGYRSKPPKGTAESARKPWDEYVHRNRWRGETAP